MPTTHSHPRWWMLVAMSLVLLAVNLAVVYPLLFLDQTAHTHSIEGTFIAIARVMANHPGDWNWWPFWHGGMPFEVAYLPLSNWIVALVIKITGLPAAQAFHISTAALYALGAPAVFWMCAGISGRPFVSFLAALSYSCLSAVSFIPHIAADSGGPLSIRRFHDLVVWGEAPHTVALVWLPLAILAFYKALIDGRPGWLILCGVAASAVALTNAFGVVTLSFAALCLLLVYPTTPFLKGPARVLLIGAAAFLWASPWLSPAMIRALLSSAATAGGDFRYTPLSGMAAAGFCAAFVAFWAWLRARSLAPSVQFFLLFACGFVAVVAIWELWGIALLPQPARYELEIDLVVPIAGVFLGATILDRAPRALRVGVAGCVLAALAYQCVYATTDAHRRVRRADPATLSEYKIATWLKANRPDERTFVAGSVSYYLNAFADVPQLLGGHKQHLVNRLIPKVEYAVYTGMNMAPNDAKYSAIWLKVLGVRNLATCGPRSTEAYKAWVTPSKFEGFLTAVWRDGDDAIYEIPARSRGLAFVIPRSAMVLREPINGIDVEPVLPYLAAMDDPALPSASWAWLEMDEALVRTAIHPGQVLSLQVAYARGWEATVNGEPQPIRADGLGQTIIEATCPEGCEIRLKYTGGWERVATRLACLLVTLLAAAALVFSRRQPDAGIPEARPA